MTAKKIRRWKFLRSGLKSNYDGHQGYIIARALDTTPGYVSKVRKEAAMDAKTHPVLDVVHTVTRGGENEIFDQA